MRKEPLGVSHEYVPASQEPVLASDKEAVITAPEPDINPKEPIVTPEEKVYQKEEMNKPIKESLMEPKTPPASTNAASPAIELSNSRYTLGTNDIIDVAVLRHPEVSGQYMINNEGSIQYEFLGDVVVTGKTKDEVADELKIKLAEFIIDPEVTVKITGYNSKVVYVIGEVGSPGKIFMRGDTITIREALLLAGLPLLTAKVEKTKLFTPSTKGAPRQKNINLDRLLYKGDLRQNLVMKPGDTLFVPPTFMTKVMRVIQPVANPITTATGAGRAATGGI
ncbi:MAG: polysaccharide biosynthesis/export family protein [Candidatus Omnitrophica bacterium]|nr:polysaccharide biosynthesis/export family protein [Candidatus Omnitrophota bacterium]